MRGKLIGKAYHEFAELLRVRNIVDHCQYRLVTHFSLLGDMSFSDRSGFSSNRQNDPSLCFMHCPDGKAVPLFLEMLRGRVAAFTGRHLDFGQSFLVSSLFCLKPFLP
ncbi:hypothetical protein [Agrobacterium sp. D14]|uniref:hypothetical protein n=1 Tax=Agrobacterium sp. D14 TaxID=1336743 RepID=UPI000B134410|nr:hypothetical protein [Agrobacterium sp. D14]